MKKLLIAIIALTLTATFVFAQYRSTSRQPQKKTLPVNVRLDQIEKRLEDLTLRIDHLEEKSSPVTKLKKQGQAKDIQLPLEVGQIVYFDNDNDFKIEQIIDKQDMIVELRIGSVPKLGSMPRTSRFSTTVPITGYKKITKLVCIRGLDTSKWADGSIIKPSPDRLFKITGTKSYDTLFEGIKTFFVLEPFNQN